MRKNRSNTKEVRNVLLSHFTLIVGVQRGVKKRKNGEKSPQQKEHKLKSQLSDLQYVRVKGGKHQRIHHYIHFLCTTSDQHNRNIG